MTTALSTLAAGEISDGALLAYTVGLAIAGTLMLIIAGIGFGQGVGRRVFNGLVGLAFLGYGFYLYFLFDGGTVFIFYYVFILPIVLIVQAIRGRNSAASES